MKHKWALALSFCAILISGCRHPMKDRADPVQVIVEGDGEFPHSLAGRWIAQQHGWEFQIEPEGRISSAIISLGRVRVAPGQTTTMPTKSGDQAVFTPGSWTVHYAPDTRELTVRITMDHVRVEMAGNIVEGSSTDVFFGRVDPTGQTWQAQWTTFTRYTAHTPDNTSVNLSTDPTNGETRPLVFEKATDKRGPS
jgi:hypothetical protein